VADVEWLAIGMVAAPMRPTYASARAAARAGDRESSPTSFNSLASSRGEIAAPRIAAGRTIAARSASRDMRGIRYWPALMGFGQPVERHAFADELERIVSSTKIAASRGPRPRSAADEGHRIVATGGALGRAAPVAEPAPRTGRLPTSTLSPAGSCAPDAPASARPRLLWR